MLVPNRAQATEPAPPSPPPRSLSLLKPLAGAAAGSRCSQRDARMKRGLLAPLRPISAEAYFFLCAGVLGGAARGQAWSVLPPRPSAAAVAPSAAGRHLIASVPS